MTRNRDDFTTLQAFKAGFVGVLVILAVMLAIGSAIQAQKSAAERRATGIAAASLDMTTTGTELAAATTQATRSQS